MTKKIKREIFFNERISAKEPSKTPQRGSEITKKKQPSPKRKSRPN